MAKDKLTDYDSTAANNLDVGGISVAEGMLPSGVNNAIRELMSHQADAFGAGTPLYVDQTNNRLGVGTSSPSADLTVTDGTSSGTLSIGDNAAGSTSVRKLQFGESDDYSIQSNANSYLRFYAEGVEAMRLDNSQNLLVGTISTTPQASGEGIVLRNNGYLIVSADGLETRSMLVNRNNEDGEIIQFAKDGASVGIIGTNSNGNFQLYGTAASHVGLQFGSPSILPINNSGSSADNAVDLGDSNVRFKDLWLSGGVYLGGVAAANLLDSYEEGTVSATIRDSSGNVSTTTPTKAFYVKVGKVCHVNIYFANVSTAGLTAGDDIRIYGLPFIADGDAVGSISASHYTPITNGNWLSPMVQNNLSYITLFESRTNASLSAANVNQFVSTVFDLRIQLSYKVD